MNKTPNFIINIWKFQLKIVSLQHITVIMSLIPFSIKDVSTYRSELMGWSILWIMMLHFGFTQIKPLGFIAQYGFSGVDIFMFVSGFGLFFSLEKNADILFFYKKRLLRIFPTYYIIGIIASLILFHDNIINYTIRYTTIGFWINAPYWEWYIPSLVALYLFAPFLKKIVTKKFFPVLLLLLVACFSFSYYVIDKEYLINREHFFFLYRIPAFIFGMITALWIKENKTNYFLGGLLGGLPAFIILYPNHHHIYNYKYFSLIFLLPSFILFFVWITQHIKLINPMLSIIGKASFEIYLIQSVLFSLILQETILIPTQLHDTVSILLIITSCILGITTHKLIGNINIYRLL